MVVHYNVRPWTAAADASVSKSKTVVLLQMSFFKFQGRELTAATFTGPGPVTCSLLVCVCVCVREREKFSRDSGFQQLSPSSPVHGSTAAARLRAVKRRRRRRPTAVICALVGCSYRQLGADTSAGQVAGLMGACMPAKWLNLHRDHTLSGR